MPYIPPSGSLVRLDVLAGTGSPDGDKVRLALGVAAAPDAQNISPESSDYLIVSDNAYVRLFTFFVLPPGIDGAQFGSPVAFNYLTFVTPQSDDWLVVNSAGVWDLAVWRRYLNIPGFDNFRAEYTAGMFDRRLRVVFAGKATLEASEIDDGDQFGYPGVQNTHKAIYQLNCCCGSSRFGRPSIS
jgi:hypothetical protein